MTGILSNLKISSLLTGVTTNESEASQCTNLIDSLRVQSPLTGMVMECGD
jgi:hypothetical protein